MCGLIATRNSTYIFVYSSPVTGLTMEPVTTITLDTMTTMKKL